MNHDVLIAFGANLGDGESNFQKVKNRLEMDFSQVCAASLIRTRAVALAETSGNEPDYWNSVFRLNVPESWTPIRFLTYLLGLETEFGRIREENSFWSSRPLDLDLLFWDSLFLDEAPTLVLPHPMMAWREFVLRPACEIASEWIHPATRSSLCEMYLALKTSASQTVPLVWEDNSPVPASLLEESGKSHRPILARRWICRNAGSENNFEEVLKLILKTAAGAKFESNVAPDCF